MHIVIKLGDILDEEVDVLISSANVHLNLSGGVNGAILERGGTEVQRELKAYLERNGVHWVPPGSVVATGHGPLRVKHILHAVAIDGFYSTSIALVGQTIARAFSESVRLGARTVALPALATGYGRLPMGEFARALRESLTETYAGLEELRVVVRHHADADTIRSELYGINGVVCEP